MHTSSDIEALWKPSGALPRSKRKAGNDVTTIAKPFGHQV